MMADAHRFTVTLTSPLPLQYNIPWNAISRVARHTFRNRNVNHMSGPRNHDSHLSFTYIPFGRTNNEIQTRKATF